MTRCADCIGGHTCEALNGACVTDAASGFTERSDVTPELEQAWEAFHAEPDPEALVLRPAFDARDWSHRVTLAGIARVVEWARERFGTSGGRRDAEQVAAAPQHITGRE